MDNLEFEIITLRTELSKCKEKLDFYVNFVERLSEIVYQNESDINHFSSFIDKYMNSYHAILITGNKEKDGNI